MVVNVHKHVKITPQIVLPETSVYSELKSTRPGKYESCALTLPLPAPGSVLTHSKRQSKLYQLENYSIWDLTPSLEPSKPGQQQRGEREEGKGEMKGRGIRGTGEKVGRRKREGRGERGGDTMNENEEERS